jgi:hypothetical protein
VLLWLTYLDYIFTQHKEDVGKLRYPYSACPRSYWVFGTCDISSGVMHGGLGRRSSSFTYSCPTRAGNEIRPANSSLEMSDDVAINDGCFE